jgi:hypothetical protein
MGIPGDRSTLVAPERGGSIVLDLWISHLNELIGFPPNARWSGKKVLPSSRGWVKLNPDRTIKWSMSLSGQATI